ncbi:MAG: amidase [Thermoflexales bacterium]|nr:amidase [Thermoflexales bacterium]
MLLDALEAALAAREDTVRAFLPEPGRMTRLRGELRGLEAAHPDPAPRGPLFGIPVAVKDIFHVRGFTTRAGSQLPPELLQGEEGPVVAALRRAGALIAGKAVTTEFAFFGPGPTRNPVNPEHTPGGSSSGSAAAVGASMVPLALGTQTIGSILRPASFCGVYGFKPSYERLSRKGVIPLSPSFDHVGLLAADLPLLDKACQVLVPDWHAATQPTAPVLGVPEGAYLRRCDPVMEAAFRNALTRLSRAGIPIVSVPMFDDFEAIRERQYDLTAHEAAHVHRDWYAAHRPLYHPRTVELIERGQGVSVVRAGAIREARLTLRADIEAVMRREGIDLWASPAAVGAAPRGLSSTGDPVMNLPWSQAGLPALALPLARDAAGLPLGLQLAAGFGRDEALLAAAHALLPLLPERPATRYAPIISTP